MSNMTGPSAERPPLDPMLTRAAIARPITAQLTEVEALFRENLASPLSLIDEIGEFIANGGGKRVRPTLHLLCARMCGYAGPHSVLLATVLEFIHSATLIHDDIIDEATTRRGREAVNGKWGNNVTVLFGDYLFAKAMEMALRADSLRVMERLADVTLRMTEGEMLQTRYEGRTNLTSEEYLDLVQRKTAALFGCCCALGGMLAGVSPEREQALERYGLNVGMAFQLVDDLLDLTGDAEILGKPAASDLREGKTTLAVIDLLGSGDPEHLALVQRIMNGSAPDSPEVLELGERLERTGALERARAKARSYAEAARAELDGFPEGDERRSLEMLPDLLLNRDH
ncbi:MAG: polyprenyl synthetase family protein [bacterium]|nr:polyprenyl synthetase family protein [bacterium]